MIFQTHIFYLSLRLALPGLALLKVFELLLHGFGQPPKGTSHVPVSTPQHFRVTLTNFFKQLKPLLLVEWLGG